MLSEMIPGKNGLKPVFYDESQYILRPKILEMSFLSDAGMVRSLNSPNGERQIAEQLSQTILNDSEVPEALRQKKFSFREDSYFGCLILFSSGYRCSNRFPPQSVDIPLFLPGGLVYRLANHSHLPPSEVHQ